jgi:hypothetical protein
MKLNTSIGAIEVLRQKGVDFGNYTPTYKLGGPYDYLIGISEKVLLSEHKNGSLDRTLETILSVTKNFNFQVSKLAEFLKADTLMQSCFNVWHFCVNNIKYKNDTYGYEEIRTPSRTWRDRHTGVDCDDFAIFCASLLMQMGYNPNFAIVAFNNNADFGHIYVVINSTLNNKPFNLNNYNGGAITNGIVIDPVMKFIFNKHPLGITKAKIMNIQILGDISSSLDSSILSKIEELKQSNTKEAKAEMRKLQFILALSGHPDQITFIKIMPLIADIENGNFVWKSKEAKQIGISHLAENVTDKSNTKPLKSLGAIISGKLLTSTLYWNPWEQNGDRSSDINLRIRVNGTNLVGVRKGNVIKISNADAKLYGKLNGYHIIEEVMTQPNANGNYSFVMLTTGRAADISGTTIPDTAKIDFEINTNTTDKRKGLSGWQRNASTVDSYMNQSAGKIENCRRVYNFIKNEIAPNLSLIKEVNYITDVNNIIGDLEDWKWYAEAAYNQCEGLKTSRCPHFIEQRGNIQKVSDVYKMAAERLAAAEDDFINKEKKIRDWMKVTNWEKVVDAIVTYNPVTIAARAGVLLALKLNFRNISKRLSIGESLAEATSRGYSEADFKKMNIEYEKFAIYFDKMGGKKENYYNAIKEGKTKNALFGGPKIDGLGFIDPATLTALAAAAVPIATLATAVATVGVLFKGKDAEDEAKSGDELPPPDSKPNLPPWVNPTGGGSGSDGESSNTTMYLLLAAGAVAVVGYSLTKKN